LFFLYRIAPLLYSPLIRGEVFIPSLSREGFNLKRILHLAHSVILVGEGAVVGEV